MAKIKINIFILSLLFLASCAQKSVQVKNTHTGTTYETYDPRQVEPPAQATPPSEVENSGSLTPLDVMPPAMQVPLNKALPKFGFIFSGGGAKAWGHVGFLKELQKLKWPVHAVAGFEWGAVVAAIYAQNLSANEVEWELSKLKEFNKSDSFLKAVFEKKSTDRKSVV